MSALYFFKFKASTIAKLREIPLIGEMGEAQKGCRFRQKKVPPQGGGGGRVFLYRDVWNGKEIRLINTVGAH